MAALTYAQQSAADLADKIRNTYTRIQSFLYPTPLIRQGDSGLYLKCENQQHTGSFKYRGALSKLSTLASGQHVITASTGNHGLGVCKAASIFNIPVQVFLPSNATAAKKKKLADLGVAIREVQGDSLAAEQAGKWEAENQQVVWVSPYNDIDVIAGQGTIALEILSVLPRVDRIYVTVGGGGLISGIAAWMKHYSPTTRIIGCQPAHSPEMSLSVKAGTVVSLAEEKDTLSDGSAGPLETDSITFPFCQMWVDEFILLDEDTIRRGIQHLYHTQQMVVEGAAAVAYMAAKTDSHRREDEISVVVLCGGNIDPLLHTAICQ